MKISNKQLKQIIKEELERFLLEKYVEKEFFFLTALRKDLEKGSGDVDDVVVKKLFKQLPVKASLDAQFPQYKIDYEKDPRAKIAYKALILLAKSDDYIYRDVARQWKLNRFGELVFKGSEQELINNTRKLNWPVKIDSRGVSKDPEQNI